jgi:plasmid stability protein
MTVTLSIKNVPDDLAQRLRRRAELNHRSLQGELMAIIEAAAAAQPVRSLRELGEFAARLGLHTPSGEAARLVREDRDDPDR